MSSESTTPYGALKTALESAGFEGQIRRAIDKRPGLLVLQRLAGVDPTTHIILPNRNSFWVAERQGQWYIKTWANFSYRVPADTDLVALCRDALNARAIPLHVVPDDIAKAYGLEREVGTTFGQDNALLFPDPPPEYI